MVTQEEVEYLEYYADNQHHNWGGLYRAATIDGPIAEQPCQECGTKREYHQVVNSGSYRAFAVCPTCQNAIEF